MQLTELEGSNILYSPNIWVADTGATCHITNSDEASIPSANRGDIKALNDSLDASGNKMKHTALVDIKGSVYSGGKTTRFTLKDCRFGASKFNLCSLTKLTDNGAG